MPRPSSRGELDAAMTRASRAIELGKETRQQGCEAQGHRVLGWALHYTSPTSREEAAASFREAIAIEERIGERITLVRTLYEFTDFLRDVGDSVESREAEAKAASLARELGRDLASSTFAQANSREGVRSPASGKRAEQEVLV